MAMESEGSVQDTPPVSPIPAVSPVSGPLAPAASSAISGESSLKNKKIVVQKPDGTAVEVSCGKKWVITALKVLLVAVIVGGFIAASVFTFGAAGAFGAAGSAALGVVSTTAIAGASNALYVTGAVLVGMGLIAVPLVAHKNRMGKYTGEDMVNAQQFLLGGARAVSNLVKKVFNSQFYTNLILGIDSAEIEKKKAVCKQILRHRELEQEIILNSDSKKFLAEAFKKLKEEKSHLLYDETKSLINATINELEDEEKKQLSANVHEFISCAVVRRKCVVIDSKSVKPFLVDNPQMMLELLLDMHP